MSNSFYHLSNFIRISIYPYFEIIPSNFSLFWTHFLSTKDTPWLDGAHVVFGKAVDGLDVIDKIESVGSQSGRTSQEVVIKGCGELTE